MKPPAPKWGSEAEMLVAFMAEVRAMGFRCVPEACGHDLVLVAGELCRVGYRDPPAGIEPGDIIAVEGKLRPSLEVLRQAMPPHRLARSGWQCSHPKGIGGVERCGTCMSCRRALTSGHVGFDFYAVVVPNCDSDFEMLGAALDVCVWTMSPGRPAGEWNPRGNPMLGRFDVPDEARCVGVTRAAVPDLDVDITPGCPAPRKLTPWKIAAVRLCLLGRTRNLLTSDFVGAVRARTFVDQRWAELVRRDGHQGVYRLLDSPTRPDRVYPEIVAAIEAQGVPSPAAAVVPGALFAGAVG